ncbi:MAG TPA: hypothetical protein VNI61_08175 [Gemmatimonadales bacterium]|nr:hypothetical protein [Gemmatimonadales bacterium]
MSERYASFVRRVRETVLGRPAVTEPGLRQAVAVGTPPPDLGPFVAKVARRAYDVTQQDVDALRRAGYSEDAIFEIIASAALGAGLARLERGLAALRGEV